MGEGKQLHKYCTDAVGFFQPFSVEETNRNRVCSIFAAATKTGEPFTSNGVATASFGAVCKIEDNNITLEKAVFGSFTETCLEKEGFEANLSPTFLELLRECVAAY